MNEIPAKIPELRPQAHGGALRTGGTNPGAGRPPEAFREHCRQLACDALEAAEAILKDPQHPAFLGALKWATEHGYGKARETIDLNHSLGLAEAMRAAEERIESRGVE